MRVCTCVFPPTFPQWMIRSVLRSYSIFSREFQAKLVFCTSKAAMAGVGHLVAPLLMSLVSGVTPLLHAFLLHLLIYLPSCLPFPIYFFLLCSLLCFSFFFSSSSSPSFFYYLLSLSSSLLFLLFPYLLLSRFRLVSSSVRNETCSSLQLFLRPPFAGCQLCVISSKRAFPALPPPSNRTSMIYPPPD